MKEPIEQKADPKWFTLSNFKSFLAVLNENHYTNPLLENF
jgi:hypothetical protein